MNQLLIYGEQDVGKSTTCRRLFNTMRALDAAVLFYERFPWGDFKTVIEIAGSKIAIYSAGDEKQHLRTALDFATEWDCHVLVAVVRAHTHYNDTLKDLVCGEDFNWFTLEKGVNMEETNLNESRMTLTLLNQISKIIGL